MRKLLSTMAALTIVSTTATTVIACSDKNMVYYTQFMDGVKNKENFIFMVSAQNCIHCQNTHDTTIADLYTNGYGNQKYDDYLTGKRGAQYALNSYHISAEEQAKIKKTRLIVTSDVKDYNNVWQQKWAKNVADWIVTQERNAHKINGEIDKSITAESLGLNGTPTYIYVKNGNYVGFETGEIGNLETGPNPNLWMQRFIKHMVLEDWDTDHNKEK
ncbi:MAG: hypothetical protein EIB84_04970 [Spiroplasma poulsonii]|uniref:Lipoprotein n=1 Tax=Spiroplasma poulsonii TaxID=2138 RepID=A0A2P6FCJ7_9MOLU|nr:hypothetical protein [Spiroplasma poulsonii]KAF0851600.1 putative lipoprotein [Spiroplasma poulsonii]MBW1242163.1 hypothetical protein [Spiroplasma poulsonii]PQM31198.1 hypothetical protein SMSRO_SF010040 [Spiroplasma poulsonii]PWF96199.1 hypothetical protein SMSE_16370 [Spiroplasma poulsonii]PWF98974.1 hypothetical protein SMH99_15370 [Spiroplasma poulsonii]